MIRKMLLAGSVVTLMSSLALGVPVWSYLRSGTQWFSQSASDLVPLEWELKRARQMISDLKPEIETNARRIAKEKVDVARLQRQLGETRERLAESESHVKRLSEDLRQENRSYQYGGKTYTATQVKSDLGHRFERLQVRQQTAEKLEQMLSARQASLRAAEERMETMLTARGQLEVEVENLQARLASLRVAQTASQMNLDDSQLSRTRELLSEIATRIDVEEETMHVDAKYFGGIDLDAPTEDDLLDRVSEYFDGGKTDRGSFDAAAVASIPLD